MSFLRRLLTLRTLLIISSSGAMLMFAIACGRWAAQPTHGFAMYYTFARTLIEGGSFEEIYAYDTFNEKVRAYGMSRVTDAPNNIPTNAFALLPVAWLPPVEAKIAWSVISLLLLLASVSILFTVFEVRAAEPGGLALLTLIFLWRPCYDAFALGQLYFFLLFLFSLSLYGVRHGRSMLTGTPLVLSFLFKGYGLAPILWLAFRRQWRACAIALGLIALGILITLPLFGIGAWGSFHRSVILTLGMRPMDGHVAYQTVNGLLLHLFMHDAQWLPSPLVELPTLFLRGISYALNLTLLLFVLKKGAPSDTGEQGIFYAAAVGAGVVTAPLAEEYHFVLFLPLVIGLLTRILRIRELSGKFRRTDWLCFLAIAIMALPIPYKELQFASFPVVLLAYPKLYAGLVLLLISLRKTPGGVRLVREKLS